MQIYDLYDFHVTAWIRRHRRQGHRLRHTENEPTKGSKTSAQIIWSTASERWLPKQAADQRCSAEADNGRTTVAAQVYIVSELPDTQS